MKLSTLLLFALASVSHAGRRKPTKSEVLATLRNPRRRLQSVASGCVSVPSPDACGGGPSPNCKAFCSPDYCANSFQDFISKRSPIYKATPNAVTDLGYWFHLLEHKLGGFAFSKSHGIRTPNLLHCGKDLSTFVPPSSQGFVIRATNLHSNQGSFVFPIGFAGNELLRGTPMSQADVEQALVGSGATGITVEEFISGPGGGLPTEYKVHIFNGEVGSISIVQNPGSSCSCWAEVDEDWNRLDTYGCFTNGGLTVKNQNNDKCFDIHFDAGLQNLCLMKSLDLCSSVTPLEPCIRNDMIAIAKQLSKEIGVYARIDFFLSASGELVVQEYSFNHMNGRRHCSAKVENGCINSCFLGDMWASNGGNAVFGGPLTPIPSAIATYLNATDRCARALSTSASSSPFVSSCPSEGIIQRAPPAPVVPAPAPQPIPRGKGKPKASPTSQKQNGVDLGIRFSKIVPVGGIEPPGMYLPMSTHSYPLQLTDASWVRQTKAISVFVPEDCFECDILAGDLVQSSGVEVWHPTSDPSDPFWQDLWETVLSQLQRMRNAPVSEIANLPYGIKQFPNIWASAGFNIGDVAEAVHDEFPGSIHVELIKELFGGALDKPYAPNCPTCALLNRTIIPFPSRTEFIRGAVMLADLNTWAFGIIGPINFSVKWFVGRARPEEVAYMIYTDRLTEAMGVPSYIVDTIKKNFTMTKMQDFTAYPEGSPDHPSWPAMHSASSAASLWMPVVFMLTKEQWCEVKAVDYAISYARTVAGVHYPTDNIAGLNIGQSILAKKLPEYLWKKYNSDKDVVASRVREVRFDWNGYLTGECFS